MATRRKAAASRSTQSRGADLEVKLRPRGPDAAALEALSESLLRNALLTKSLGRKHRLLGIDLVEPDPDSKSGRPPAEPAEFQATFYSYSNEHCVLARGPLANPRKIEVSASSLQPRPTSEEFQEAVAIVARDPAIGALLREGRLRPYPPMPPLLSAERPDGHVERTVAVGLLPVGAGTRDRHEIVGANLIRGELQRFEGAAPPTSKAVRAICGLPYAGQPTASHAPGQVWVTVSQAGQVLWKFLAVRPAASSGTNGSGIELRFVDYRGKRVLYRAHVPILNVKYDGNACGPYRDWQNEEGMIQASGADVAPGFRLCPSPAKTILDTGSDSGTFLGVGIYVQGQEVVLVSEMEAGWYRYVSEWRLGSNGTIKPRFGFSAVSSSCVCNRHHHHAYWRLDFDIRTAGGNRVREFNDPPLIGPSKWHTKSFEIQRPRDPARKRKWRVVNVATGEGYDIVPGSTDGVATAAPDWPFPRGDVWFLRYRGSEIDDGSVAVGPPYEAGLDAWVNGESINGQDVVVWYGAHFTHELHEEPGEFGHIVGPTLTPVSW